MTDILAKLTEAVLFASGAYIAGLIVIVPGMVIGKMMEERSAPQWPNHVAILVVGLVALCLIFYRTGGGLLA